MDLVKEIKRIRSKDEIYILSLLKNTTFEYYDSNTIECYNYSDELIFYYFVNDKTITLSFTVHYNIKNNLNVDTFEINDDTLRLNNIILKCVKNKFPELDIIKIE